VPFDLRHDPPGFLPALRLIGEAGEVAAHLVQWSPDRALEQVSDPALQDAVGRQADRVAGALGFEELAHLGIGEGRVASEIKPLHPVSVASVCPRRCRAEKVPAVEVPAPPHNQQGSRGRMPWRASLKGSLHRNRLDQARVIVDVAGAQADRMARHLLPTEGIIR
jgi:hypothetical protein